MRAAMRTCSSLLASERTASRTLPWNSSSDLSASFLASLRAIARDSLGKSHSNTSLILIVTCTATGSFTARTCLTLSRGAAKERPDCGIGVRDFTM